MDQTLLLHFNLLTKVLERFGMWQEKNCSKSLRFRGSIVVSLYFTLNFLLPVVNFFNSDEIFEEAINSLFIFTAPTFKVVIFYFRMVNMKKLLDDLGELLTFTKCEKNVRRMEMRRQVRFMARLFMVFYGLVVISALSDLTIPLLDNRLPYKTWIPYNQPITNSELLWVFSVSQVAVGIMTGLVAVCIEMYPVFFMAMASVMLKELANRMKLLNQTHLTDTKVHEELVKCVRVHQKLSSFIRDIEAQFSAMFFIQGFFTASYICLTVFILSSVSSM
jgi:hypothetical protein